MRKISVLFSLFIILALLSTGCSEEKDIGDFSDSNKEQNILSSELEESAKEDISNLPTYLYQTTEMRTSHTLRHDFSINEATDFEISISTLYGKASIGIINRDTDTYILEMTECSTDKFNKVISLEESGQYSVVLELSEHTGSYEIIGTPRS